MNDYLTVHEVAERMRCEHRTVRRAIRAGHLEAAMIGGRWLIRAGAVDAWFDSKRVAPPTPRRERSFAPRRDTTAERDRRGSVARLKTIEGSSGG
jgi:excisionase family DNA binding protein